MNPRKMNCDDYDKSFLSPDIFLHPHSFLIYIETTVVEKYFNTENTEQSPLTREPPQQRQGISTEFNPPQREMLQRMRSVTNASDEICSSILKKKNFDLNSSIDSYFLGER